MTLQTGNNQKRFKRLWSGVPKGITFIEVMVTVVILSVGLVAIYRSFLIGADLTIHLSNRLLAFNALENRIAVMERELKALRQPDTSSFSEEFVTGGRTVVYNYSAQLKPVSDLLSVFQFDVTISWQERERTFSFSRSAYVSGLSSLRTTKEVL